MRTSINSPYWGGQPPSAGQASLPVQFSNGTSATLPTGTQQITEYGGPGATIPTGMNETSDYAGPGATMPAESQPTTHRGGHGSQGGQSQAQLAANQASGNPVEVGAGVWVYPNGQIVTGAQLQALNSASTVQQASSASTDAALLAQEQAAAAATATTATTATTTSWLDESTIAPTLNLTNGQVVMYAGAALAAFYLLKKR
jgi:hypothetical protein